MIQVFRKQEIGVNFIAGFKLGDQICLGKYTATCQKIEEKSALFLLDQYLDEVFVMNHALTNRGGYNSCALRVALQTEVYVENFDEIRPYLLPFADGDLLRLPTVEEFFGPNDFYEAQNFKQWDLMREQKNRLAHRKGEIFGPGWLQNRVPASATAFACVDRIGKADFGLAAYAKGVRPVFQIGAEEQADNGSCAACAI